MKALFAALLVTGAAACGQADVRQMVDEKVGAAPLPLTGRVVDIANLIDPTAEAALTSKLAALEAATSDQLVVMTVPTLKGATIEQYTRNLGNRWGIGRSDFDNGVIILVAPTERRVRIEVGYGLEGLLTDAKASEIIKGTILPRFKAGDYAGGMRAGADQIDRLLRSDRRRPQLKPITMRKVA